MNQRHKILQSFVWWVDEKNSALPYHHHHTNVYEFSQLCGAIFSLSCKVILSLKLGKFTNEF